jgi:transcriptional regulator with XRE-family HTH domain
MKDLEKFFSKKNDTTGKIIKSFRKNFNITQAELCKATGISEKYLSAVENDNREIGLEVATKIAVFFNFDPFFLIFPNGLDELHDMYPDIIKESQKLITKKRKSA